MMKTSCKFILREDDTIIDVQEGKEISDVFDIQSKLVLEDLKLLLVKPSNRESVFGFIIPRVHRNNIKPYRIGINLFSDREKRINVVSIREMNSEREKETYVYLLQKEYEDFSLTPIRKQVEFGYNKIGGRRKHRRKGSFRRRRIFLL